MALTTIKTAAIADDAVTTDKLANAINTERTANTAKDLTALSASNLTSGTVPDARFPATLPAASAANLTAVPAANITGTLPAISAANLTSIPAANITGTLPAISGANLTGISSAGTATNFVVNGAMNISQRGQHDGSQVQYDAPSTNDITLDRFGIIHTSARFDVNQSSTAPDGFAKSMKLTVNSADTSIGASQFTAIRHRIEGQNLQSLAFGTSSAKSISLSFYVRSNVTGTYAVNIQQSDNSSKHVSATYTISSADTWEKKTFTFAGDTSGVINNDNGTGLTILWWLVAGSNYSSGTARSTWTAFADADSAAGHTANPLHSTSNNFRLTGIQLEAGDSCTDFQHKLISQDLADCMRYYQIVIMSGHPNGGGQTGGLGGTMYSNGSSIYCPYRFPVEMRAEPTVNSSNGTGSGSGTFRTRLGHNHSFNNFSGFNDGNPQSGTFITNGNAGGGNVGDYVWIETNSGAKLALNAEL